jgi:hypothetical protein
MPFADGARLEIGWCLEPVVEQELRERLEHEQRLARVLRRLGASADDVVGCEGDWHGVEPTVETLGSARGGANLKAE